MGCMVGNRLPATLYMCWGRHVVSNFVRPQPYKPIVASESSQAHTVGVSAPVHHRGIATAGRLHVSTLDRLQQ